MFAVTSISVSSTTNSSTILQKAGELAARLDLPFVSASEHQSSGLVLAYTPQGLQLLLMPGDGQRPACLLFVDFVNGKNGFRLAKNRTTKQPISRAVGIRSGFRPDILDGTAGLGADAFVLASLGCCVTMCERSPILGALLEDGLNRAAAETKTAGIVARMKLHIGDTAKYLLTNCQNHHTIYLDPMYPHRSQSALNKQTLRVIRALVGDDQDSAPLLQVAREKAVNRVVVKRPRLAPLLSDRQPSHVVLMKNSRFDIYLTFNN